MNAILLLFTDSESGDEATSQPYNPSTAPIHDDDDALEPPSSADSRHKQTSFFNPQSMNGMSTFMGLDNAEIKPDALSTTNHNFTSLQDGGNVTANSGLCTVRNIRIYSVKEETFTFFAKFFQNLLTSKVLH